MTATEISPGTCGTCALWRPSLDGKSMFCRAPLGLLLGERGPEDPCRKPESYTEAGSAEVPPSSDIPPGTNADFPPAATIAEF